jgi:hypothetical protein
MNNPSLVVQVLKGLYNLFDDNLCHGFFDAQLPTLVVVLAEEAPEVPPVAVLQHEVIVVLGTVFAKHPYYSVVLHLGENQCLIKNII